jgi:hypothetical protein
MPFTPSDGATNAEIPHQAIVWAMKEAASRKEREKAARIVTTIPENLNTSMEETKSYAENAGITWPPHYHNLVQVIEGYMEIRIIREIILSVIFNDDVNNFTTQDIYRIKNRIKTQQIKELDVNDPDNINLTIVFKKIYERLNSLDQIPKQKLNIELKKRYDEEQGKPYIPIPWWPVAARKTKKKSKRSRKFKRRRKSKTRR